MKARLSVLGMYNYDSTIFDDLVLPNGILKDDVVMNLLIELSELELLYSNPQILKTVIGFWSNKELKVWNKLNDSTNFVYNPIWNKDGTEIWSNKETRDLHENATTTRDLHSTGVVTSDMHNNNKETRDLVVDALNRGEDITQELVYGFNDEHETSKSKIVATLGTGNNKTDTGTVDVLSSNTGTVGSVDGDTGTIGNVASDIGTVLHEYSQKAQGNIGVTTTQQMIKEERQVVQFNVVDYIINSFKKRFCLLVY